MENNAKENKKHSTQPNVQKGNTENSSYNSDIKQNIKECHSSLEIKIVQCNICYEAWPLSTSTKGLKDSEYYVCARCKGNKKPQVNLVRKTKRFLVRYQML